MRREIHSFNKSKDNAMSISQTEIVWNGSKCIYTKNIYCNTQKITQNWISPHPRRRLLSAIQLRKAVWVLQYNVENFDSLNLRETLTHELFSLTVYKCL